MKRTYSYLIIFLMTIVILSCKKDPPANNPGNGGKPVSRLSKVSNGEFITELLYNPDGTVKKLVNKNAANQASGFAEFIYQDNKLVKTVEPGYQFAYSYEAGHVSAIVFSDDKNHVYQQYKYSYAGDDITEVLVDMQENGILRPYYKNVYSYAKPGNESKAVFYTYENNHWEKTGEKITTAFDSHLNYTNWLDTYPFLLSVKDRGNNPLHEEHLDFEGKPALIIDYTYTYDSTGRPLTIKKVTKDPAGGSTSSTSIVTY